MEKPKHSCARPGCPILTHKRYCDQHADLGKRAHRERHSEVYDSPGWKQYSRDYLAKHPVCADPFGLHHGVPVRATCTGHKVAHRGDMRLFSDPANHYPLCNSCNASQACRTEGGFGNPMRKKSE